MIKPERLKELYKNGAIVYGVYREYDDYGHYDNIIEEQDLAEGYYIDVYEKYGITGILDDLKNTYDNLYETKSEAEFYAKYGNITRIEKMPSLLNWNELKQYKQNNDYYSIRWCKNMFEIGIQYLFLVNLKSKNISLRREVDGNINKYLIDEKLTEQSYYKALDKMVELWREEV